MIEQKLDWNKCVGLCTDGAAAMVGRQARVIARVKLVAAQETANAIQQERNRIEAAKTPNQVQVYHYTEYNSRPTLLPVPLPSTPPVVPSIQVPLPKKPQYRSLINKQR